jgi:hypothetical protein
MDASEVAEVRQVARKNQLNRFGTVSTIRIGRNASLSRRRPALSNAGGTYDQSAKNQRRWGGLCGTQTEGRAG